MGLWDTPAPVEPLDLPLPSPEELAESVKKLQEDPEFQERLRKRLAPYRTKVDWAR